jgi:N-acetylmuramoyl-L-alanine amidase CwlA
MGISYEIIKKIIEFNNPNIGLNPIGGVVHNTANLNDSAEMEYNYFNSADRSASAHAFVDDKTIIQTIDWNCKAWHAGQTANRMYWGIEMCTTKDPIKFNEIWKRVVWLYSYLFLKVANPPIYFINKTNLRSHREVSDQWKETDHTDPDAYFEQFGVNMDMLRDAVQLCINKGIINDIEMVVKSMSPVQLETYDTIFVNLNTEGIVIHEKRFDDPIKRGELFAVIWQLMKWAIKKFVR